MGDQERRSVVTATIANGESLSGAVDLTEQGKRLLGIQMPAAWTEAGLTFQASAGGSTYVDLYMGAAELAIPTVVASSFVILPSANDFLGLRYLKIRSGTTGTPVNQGAARTLQLVLLPLGDG